MFADIDAERRAPAALDEVRSAQAAWDRQHRRPPVITAREALAVLQFDSTVVFLVAEALAAGHTPTEEDREALKRACLHIDAIYGEAG